MEVVSYPSWFTLVELSKDVYDEVLASCITIRGENGTDIFRPYSRLNSFRGVQICPYPSLDIEHPIPYPYSNTQIAYL
jgi:hypothetical protein